MPHKFLIEIISQPMVRGKKKKEKKKRKGKEGLERDNLCGVA